MIMMIRGSLLYTLHIKKNNMINILTNVSYLYMLYIFCNTFRFYNVLLLYWYTNICNFSFICFTRKPAHNIRLWRRFLQIPSQLTFNFWWPSATLSTHTVQLLKGDWVILLRLDTPHIRGHQHIMPYIFQAKLSPLSHTCHYNLPNPSLNSISQISNPLPHINVAVGNLQYTGHKIFIDNSSTFNTFISYEKTEILFFPQEKCWFSFSL